MKLPLATIAVVSVALWHGTASANTTVHQGEVSQFSSPDDLDLEGDIVYAVNFDQGGNTHTINGVTFTPDTQAIPGASFVGPRNVTPWQSRPEFGNSANDNELEELMRDIRWASAGSSETLQANLDVTTGFEYKLQLLISGNRPENRNWDVRVDGVDCVDEISSLGIQPGAAYSQDTAVAFTFEFVAPDSQVNIVMGNLFGSNVGGDRNAIWQALTLEKVTIPPTPESLALDPSEFFATQTGAVGTFTTTDLKSGATHLYSLVPGAGSTDNAKFQVDDDTLKPGLFDFTTLSPGATFDVRVRTTDAEDPARFLEQTFTLTMVAPLAPTAISLSATSVSSGSIAGSPVGQIGTTDANTVDAHTYSLVAGAGAADNTLFTVDGGWLRLAAPIPAGRTQVELRLRTTDLAGLFFEQAFTLAVTDPSLRINEIVASNGTGLMDEDGEQFDWFEIFNETAGTAPLAGYYITDDPGNLTKWQFPAVSIPPNEYLVVFASGKDRKPTDGSNLHTNFQLDSGGEYLALVEPDGTTIASQIDFPEQLPDISYGHNTAATEIGFLQSATPGALNSAIAAQVLNEVSFSHERGFYDANFTLTLSPTIPGSTIRYTTNGSKPSASSGTVYSAPIPISPDTSSSTRGTKRIRAIAIDPSAAISPVATHTYLFINGVAAPNTDGVVGQGVFQSSIKNHPTYGPIIDDGLLAFPAISIVKPGGIGSSEGETSLELISHDGGEAGFGIDCGIKIVGGASTGSPKNNFRCYFRAQYGNSKLRYDLFRDHPYTEGGSDEFDVIQLRSGSHDNFYWMANPNNQSNGAYRPGDAQFIRNRWIGDVEMIMGHTSLHGRYAHCFYNGVYHGLYHIYERPMHHYMDKYFGGDPEDYHYTNSGRTGSDHGGGDTWSTTWGQVKAAASTGGQASKDWINWASLADNQLLYFYAGNAWDWTSKHNWMAAGPKAPGQGGWRFYSWDCDVMIYDVTAHNLNKGAPDGVFDAMMNDTDFRVFFSDRVYRHCFHNGVLTPGGCAASYNYRMNEIFEALVPETARWQSAAINPPWDRDDEWTNEWNYIENTYFQQRTAILLSQLRTQGWYPLDAPEYTQHGGSVAQGYAPVITAGPGTVYITTDGSDPRHPGGAVSPTAQIYDGTATLDKSTVVKARLLNGGTWSAVNEVRFTVGTPADSSNLAVTEFSYRPLAPSASEDPGGIYSRTDFEFVELTNISTETIDLNDVRFTDGITFDFSTSPVFGLAPGEQIVIVEDAGAFLARYPSAPAAQIAGEYSGNLSNDGERLEILGTGDALIREFTYNDKVPWPEAADGDGYSAELMDPFLNSPHDDGSNWCASRGLHGTPLGIVTVMTFSEWQALNFTAAELADPLLSGPDADFDGDGLSNFAEFGLGTPPREPVSWGKLPEVGSTEVAGEEYLTITYREWAGASGVSYSVEVSDTLSGWAGGPGAVVEVETPVDNGDGTVTRTFRSVTPISGQMREFIRLKMTG